MSCSGWALAERPELIWLASVKVAAEWVVGMASQRVGVSLVKVPAGVKDKKFNSQSSSALPL